jgi:hypothetical protein
VTSEECLLPVDFNVASGCMISHLPEEFLLHVTSKREIWYLWICLISSNKDCLLSPWRGIEMRLLGTCKRVSSIEAMWKERELRITSSYHRSWNAGSYTVLLRFVNWHMLLQFSNYSRTQIQIFLRVLRLPLLCLTCSLIRGWYSSETITLTPEFIQCFTSAAF